MAKDDGYFSHLFVIFTLRTVQFICPFVDWIPILVFDILRVFLYTLTTVRHNDVKDFLALLWFHLLCIHFSISCNTICLSMFLFWAIGMFFRKFLPMPITWSVSPLLEDSRFQSLKILIQFCITFHSGWKIPDLFSFFYLRIFRFPNTIYWRDCLFSIVCFGYICSKPGDSVASFEIRYYDSSGFALSAQNSFVYLGSFVLP